MKIGAATRLFVAVFYPQTSFEILILRLKNQAIQSAW